MTHPEFSRIIYALQEPVLLVDPRGTVVGANPRASRLFRRPPPELVGKRLTTLVADDPEELTEYLRRCSQNSTGLQGDLHIRPSHHQPIPCKVVGGSARKKQTHLVWLRLLPGNLKNPHVADYNKRQKRAQENRAPQQSEQRWRAAFENSAVGIVMADFAGRYFASNSVFRSMLGYTESELYQLTFLDVTFEEDRKANLALLRELVEGKRRHFEIEKRYRRKDGTLLWVRNNVALVPRMGTAQPFWFGIVEDITARKETEQVLRKTQAELARFSRLTTMGELAASIAHEVNQPLAAVTNNGNACLRLLANRNLDPEVLRLALEEIVADGTRASAVISRIRSFIKKTPAQRNILNVNSVIQEVLALLNHEFEKNRILFECQLAKPLPVVLADRVELQQILLNLIMNGIEAMTAVTDRPRVLRVQSRIGESGDVLVEVCDSGIGFGSEADRLFTPFFTTKPNGMGMGLPISRSLVEDHGGRLWAEPNVPHGTLFSFILPVCRGGI